MREGVNGSLNVDILRSSSNACRWGNERAFASIAPWEIEFPARECVACGIPMHRDIRDAPRSCPFCTKMRHSRKIMADDAPTIRPTRGTVMQRDRHNRVAFCYLDNAGLRRGPRLARRLVIMGSSSVERQYEGNQRNWNARRSAGFTRDWDTWNACIFPL